MDIEAQILLRRYSILATHALDAAEIGAAASAELHGRIAGAPDGKIGAAAIATNETLRHSSSTRGASLSHPTIGCPIREAKVVRRYFNRCLRRLASRTFVTAIYAIRLARLL